MSTIHLNTGSNRYSDCVSSSFRKWEEPRCDKYFIGLLIVGALLGIPGSTAGVGLYFMQFRFNDEALGGTETRFGLNTGGGIEYFFNRTLVLKGEGRYHAVGNVDGLDPSGIALTMGLKTYF